MDASFNNSRAANNPKSLNLSINIDSWRLGQSSELNVGDSKSNPSSYFKTQFEISNIYADVPSTIDNIIIGGGGLWHPPILKKLKTWINATSGARIAWGIGHNFHKHYTVDYQYSDYFDLFGTRDWGYEKIAKTGVWVPCASCMDPIFDYIPEPSESIGSVMHKHYRFESGMSSIHNFKAFDEIIKHIFKFETILTNSYHGAYWATLAGRKVIIIDPFSTRFLNHRFQPVFAPSQGWQSRVSSARAFPEALDICRKANVTFFERVNELLSDPKKLYLRTKRTISPPKQIPNANQVTRLTDFPIDSLTCYKIPGFNKIRLGNTHDGGYVIIDKQSYDKFISCGIGRDNSFEQHFLDLHGSLDCHAFDRKIKELNHPNRRMRLIRKSITAVESDHSTNLHKLIETGKDIFLKMDIEGGEFPWINSLSDEHLVRLKQIVIEFHRPFDGNRWKCLERLAHTHYLVHLHGNNFGSCVLHQFGQIEHIEIGRSEKSSKTIKLGKKYPRDTKLVIKRPVREQFRYLFRGDTLEVKRIDKNAGWGQSHTAIINAQYVPQVFECTYFRKHDIHTEVHPNPEPIPTQLDMPNYSKTGDIYLSGYPYSSSEPEYDFSNAKNATTH